MYILVRYNTFIQNTRTTTQKSIHSNLWKVLSTASQHGRRK